jgi:hypothetical protein
MLHFLWRGNPIEMIGAFGVFLLSHRVVAAE